MGESFLICSGKGGTGKTTSAINLGAAISRIGKKAIVVDANLLTPNVAFHLKIPAEKYVNDLINGNASLADAAYLLNENFAVIPASFKVKSLQGFKSSEFKKIIMETEKHADITLIDCAPGLGSEVTNALSNAANTIMVVNPEIPSVADAVKAIQVANELEVNVKGAIINRVKKFNNKLSKEKIASVLEVPILGSVPEDHNVYTSIHSGKPLVEDCPFSPASKAFKKIAANLTGTEYKREGIIEVIKAFLGKY